MKITVWSIKNDSGATIHNHIENGWSDSNHPESVRGQVKYNKWERKYAHLVDGIVVHI